MIRCLGEDSAAAVKLVAQLAYRNVADEYALLNCEGGGDTCCLTHCHTVRHYSDRGERRGIEGCASACEHQIIVLAADKCAVRDTEGALNVAEYGCAVGARMDVDLVA